jgi:hypothetical protein
MDFLTIKYSQTVGIEEERSDFGMRIAEYRLFQNVPNPFSQLTAISYQLKAPGHTTLKIYDLSGRLVETLVDKKQKGGIYSVDWHSEKVPSGIYFYQLNVRIGLAGDFVDTKKLILLK